MDAEIQAEDQASAENTARIEAEAAAEDSDGILGEIADVGEGLIEDVGSEEGAEVIGALLLASASPCDGPIEQPDTPQNADEPTTTGSNPGEGPGPTQPDTPAQLAPQEDSAAVEAGEPTSSTPMENSNEVTGEPEGASEPQASLDRSGDESGTVDKDEPSRSMKLLGIGFGAVSNGGGTLLGEYKANNGHLSWADYGSALTSAVIGGFGGYIGSACAWCGSTPLGVFASNVMLNAGEDELENATAQIEHGQRFDYMAPFKEGFWGGLLVGGVTGLTGAKLAFADPRGLLAPPEPETGRTGSFAVNVVGALFTVLNDATDPASFMN